ncbi:hypothetical protein SynRS9902_02031 [Synechococcus sp. RS9902]|nr:hypothetical protein SynRS9902_02031 [Synechococcus sp. RS9902]
MNEGLLSLAITASSCVVGNRMQAEPQLMHVFCYHSTFRYEM